MNKFIPLALAALCVAGCKPKPKEVAPIARAEAAQNDSEAEFATQIRDYARAEGLLAKSVELDPDVPRYWKELGSARKHTGDLSGAKKAYEKARDLLAATYKKTPSGPALLGEIEACLLLGKRDEAQALLDKAVKDHPSDDQYKLLVDKKVIGQMLASPSLISSAL